MEKAWQSGRICESWVERLGAGHVVPHGTLGQESDERHNELSNVGHPCQDRGLARWLGATQQLDFAILDRDDHHRKIVAMLEKLS